MTATASLPSLFLSCLLTLTLIPAALSVQCPDKFPSWTIHDYKVSYGNEVRIGGAAAFNITNDLTKTTDPLTCRLLANSFCQIDGTPSDKNLNIYIQMIEQTLYVTINETITCDGGAPAG
jgi:hypothetical protein